MTENNKASLINVQLEITKEENQSRKKSGTKKIAWDEDFIWWIMDVLSVVLSTSYATRWLTRWYIKWMKKWKCIGNADADRYPPTGECMHTVYISLFHDDLLFRWKSFNTLLMEISFKHWKVHNCPEEHDKWFIYIHIRTESGFKFFICNLSFRKLNICIPKLGNKQLAINY